MMNVLYANAIGSVMYVMVCSKPDIAYALEIPTSKIGLTKAKYIVATEATKECQWLKGLLNELGLMGNLVELCSDNQSDIFLSKNPIFHDRPKHINVKFHFIRDIVDRGDIKLIKILTKINTVDASTKVIRVYEVKMIKLESTEALSQNTTKVEIVEIALSNFLNDIIGYVSHKIEASDFRVSFYNNLAIFLSCVSSSSCVLDDSL
ncbi:uncharacterized protein LOC111376512 [Olea europaea var. sylvestris]|uniref:uncharacterized protein LOC111376512 n=1 Tax=Olea europaea var. sylvestris TaxID=158386 RepID=UPI000C1D12C0|nr:uncharacterized protein LOC111376512 [Olea europaea var. sylvestris]